MPLVNIMINQRAYTVACDDGEEEHLRDLGKHVDSKVREILETVGQVGDGRLLLMAALLITDEYFEATTRLQNRVGAASEHPVSETKAKSSAADANAMLALEAATKRLNDIAARLSEA